MTATKAKKCSTICIKMFILTFFLVMGFALIRGRKNVIPPPCQVNCNGINHSPAAAEEGKVNNIFHQNWIFLPSVYLSLMIICLQKEAVLAKM